MTPVAFSLQFRGFSTPLVPGVVTARASAPSGALVVRIDAHGPHSAFATGEGEEALLECRLTFIDEERFDEVGTISFGHGNALRFRSIVPGTLSHSPHPSLRQGAATWEIDGGAGVFDGASGRIASTFLLSDDGELTDHHVGVVFVEERA